MHLDYWEEQIKATLVTAAHLAVPIICTERIYLPMLVRSYQGQGELNHPITTAEIHDRSLGIPGRGRGENP